MNDLTPKPITEAEMLTPHDIISKKASISAVALGTSIIKEMIGDSVSIYGNPDDLATLMSAAIINELNI